MLLIVGHGPSILSGLGAVIDAHTVVRLKTGLPREAAPVHWGTRTDYLCARSQIYNRGEAPFWRFQDDSPWLGYYRRFSRVKPSTGLCAVFCAIDALAPLAIALIGFDRLLHPEDVSSRKWCETPEVSRYRHDQRAEHECLYSLGPRIIDLAEEYGTLC